MKLVGPDGDVVFYLCVCLLGEFLSSHTQEKIWKCFNRRLHDGPEDIWTSPRFQELLKTLMLPRSPCWFGFYQDGAARSALTTHQLFSMQQLSYGPGPTAGLRPEPGGRHRGRRRPSYDILHVFMFGMRMQLPRSPRE